MENQLIVITGSTRGIGLGLANAFLELGCAVTISGREVGAVQAAEKDLRSRFKPEFVFGQKCDVSDPAQVQTLWDATVRRFGKVDIWVNNAGWSGEAGMVWERPPEEFTSVIATNLLGTIYGAGTAMRGMLAQGFGAIYNMEGMGADGRKHAGLTGYGTSKYAVHYLTESLALEAKDTPIIIGSLRPGMVITQMITARYSGRPEELQRARRIFNIIADTVEHVAPWLAKRILDNRKNGAVLAYSSTWKLLWRFASQPFVRRNLI